MASKGSKAPFGDEDRHETVISPPEDGATDPPLSSAQTHTLSPGSENRPLRYREISIQPGQTLAGRFRVERFLGSGGMGQVFAAEDLVLGESVAIKIMRSVFDGTGVERRRLVREVQLARRVTHRNVCRIFDLFQHQEDPQAVGYDSPPLDIVSMELLAGRNLTEHLDGRALSTEEALALARQVARGLHAAHSLGIVHRDLKPGNIMLVQEPEGRRVAITDFGLAQQVGPGSRESVLTEEGKILGTPAYMAPEQVADEGTSPATDIYALGIILFECLSGRLPFRGDTPWQIAVSRLTTPPRSLAHLMPNLDPAIVGVIETCLARSPEDRFSSSRELLDALDQGDSGWEIYGRKQSSAAAEPPPPDLVREPTTSRREWIVAGALVALGVAGLGLSLQRGGPSDTETTAVASRADSPPSVIIRDRADRSSEQRFLDPSLEALLAGGDSPEPPPLTEPALRQRKQALQDAVRSHAVYDAPTARRILQQALEEIPRDPLLISALAETLWRLGFESDARVLSAHSLRHLANLSQEERLLIETRHSGLTGDWEQAAAGYRDLWQINPSVEYGLWIVEAVTLLGKVDPMPEVFAAIRELLGDREDARVDIWQSRALDNGSDLEKALKLARNAVAIAEKSGQPALIYKAYRQLSVTLRRSDRDSESAEAYRWAERSLDEVEGNPYLNAEASMRRGENLSRIGREVESLIDYERADRAFSKIGSDRGRCQLGLRFGLVQFPDLRAKADVLERAGELCRVAGLAGTESWVLHHLARTQRDLGEFRQAVDLFFESGEIRGRLGDNLGLAQGWTSLAVLLSMIGRVDEAMEKVEEAQELLRTEHEPARLQVAQMVGAVTAIQAGRLEDARAWLAAVEERGVRNAQLLSLHEIKGKLAWATGDAEGLFQASAHLEEHARSFGLDQYLAMAAAFQAEALELRGRHTEALAVVHPHGAAHEFGHRLVTSLLHAGQLDEARAALNDYSEFVAGHQRRPDRWTVDILTVELEIAAAGEPRIQRLNSIAREARNNGNRQTAIHADLVRLRHKGSIEGLKKLKKEAVDLGFGGFARSIDHALSQQTTG